VESEGEGRRVEELLVEEGIGRGIESSRFAFECIR